MRISDWSSDVCSSDLFANQPDAMRRWGKTVAFGHLFERDATPLPGADRSGILDIRCPAEVLQHYWGSYSLCFESDDRVEIMRDPRSEERSVGKGCVRTGRYRWSPDH